MFEKQAKEYAKRKFDEEEQTYLHDIIAQTYQRAAEFGYNKGRNEAREIIRQLIANAPNTYSGTDIELQQKKMFSFQDAVNKAEQFIKEAQ